MLRSENVPETAEAERVMEEMIRQGAKIIFPTSYGHRIRRLKWPNVIRMLLSFIRAE